MKKDISKHARMDLRGFSYGLAPYVAQQNWAMEALENQIALTNKQLSEAKAQREAVRVSLRDQAAHLQSLMKSRLDPVTYRHGLEFLNRLQTRIQQIERHVEETSEKLSELQSAWKLQHRKLDGLDKHRDEAVDLYATELARVQSAEADRDWIARLRFRARGLDHTMGEVS